MSDRPQFHKLRVGAVSYLNSVPLILGMSEGPQASEVDLTFSLPAVCAKEIEDGTTGVGLVPVAEIARQNLEIVPDLGIACLGAVRSILLISRVPWRNVGTLAADSSSRTSVELSRIILRERYGVEPEVRAQSPSLEQMLQVADAALIIGDPALRIEPEAIGYEWLDLGAEWFALTQMPMVFAAWAGRPDLPVDRLRALTRASYEFGKVRLNQIVESEYQSRGISRALAYRYLHKYIRYELGPAEERGLETFFDLANLSVART